MNFKRWETYLVDLNPVVGTKPGKVRPCVVVQNDDLNAALHPSTTILPITTQAVAAQKLIIPLRVFLPAGEAGMEHDSVILVDQILTWDNRRFHKRMGELGTDKIRELCMALAQVYDF